MDHDRNAIRLVISQQLDGFQKDDAQQAFSYASPAIQAQFGTPENFIEMVKTAYPPVYRPRSVLFSDLTTLEGYPTQQVILMDESGQLVRALYLMHQLANGMWRIAGCYLVPVPPQQESS